MREDEGVYGWREMRVCMGGEERMGRRGCVWVESSVEDKIVLTQYQAIAIFDLTCCKIGRTLFYVHVHVYKCYYSIEDEHITCCNCSLFRHLTRNCWIHILFAISCRLIQTLRAYAISAVMQAISAQAHN